MAAYFKGIFLPDKKIISEQRKDCRGGSVRIKDTQTCVITGFKINLLRKCKQPLQMKLFLKNEKRR